MRRKLSECKDGYVGVIVSVDDEAGWGMERIGFVPGGRVKILRRALMGEPVQVELTAERASFAVASDILKLVIVEDEAG